MRRYTCLVTAFVIGLFVIVTMHGSSSAKLKVFQQGTPEELLLAKSISLSYLETKISEYGIKNIDDLKVSRVAVDDLSMAHMRVQQTIKGVPVFGGEAIVHLKSDGSFSTLTDNLVSNVSVNTRPDYSKEEAANIALGLYGCTDCLTAEPEADLLVLRRKNKDHLVYRVQLRREDGSHDTAMPVYFIDAHSGKKVWNYDNLQTATGVSLYSGTVSIDTSGSGTSFFMEDLVRKMGTYNYNNSTTTAARFTDTDNIWNSTVQQAGVEAHFGAAKVFDYFQTKHGRNGINGSGGPLTSSGGSPSLIGSRVHYSSNYNNAFWNGSYMTYGDGNGTTFTPLVTTDITGHEMTHGVTQFTANLTYSGESGALNESMSDIFGAMVERTARGGAVTADTWKIGEQCFTPATPGDALRYMDNPHAASNSGFTSDDDPDHYSERYTGSSDNGGVHINSGISNKIFYLAAVGGTNHLSTAVVTGIGADAAEKIWYRGLSTYMTASTNFAGARTAMTNAANDLHGAGSTQVTAVQTAFCACGVGACPTPPSTSPTISASPTSFSYSATAGGANPANQSLSINNSGGGTLTFSISDNANWLSVSLASGTAPATATVSVNIAGLTAGTYNGTITITAAGATNSPFSIPVTLTVNPAGGGGGELIANGGFEVSANPWVRSGTGSFYVANGNFPHGGIGYIYFGVNNSVTGQAYQQISIPSTATGTLTFWLNVSSSETTTITQYDKLFVEVRNTAGTLLTTLATYSNLNKGTAGAYLQKSLSLANYKGQTVRVQFRSTTDSSLATTFRVDDVSAK